MVASLAVEHRLYGAQASVVVGPGLWSTGSLAVVHGLSGSVVCGIFQARVLEWVAIAFYDK